MTAPSNANTSGLAEKLLERARVSTDPLLAMYASQASKQLVTAASAQARIDAAEARADRLAKALEPFARVARWARLCGMSDLEKATAKYAKRNLFWDQFSAADAALSGDTDHAG